MKDSDYDTQDCNEDAVRQSTKAGKWKKAGQLQSEANLSDRYSKNMDTE